MKKIIIFLLMAVIGLVAAFAYFSSKGTGKIATNNSSVPTIGITAKATPTITEISPAAPQTINIPKLNVAANVESVGLASSGRMDVPSNFLNTAWYKYGPVPGATGNSVIAGHFDTPTGAPSVFYYIGNLTNDDEIMVTDENGKKYTFKVYDVENFPDATFPIDKVFGTSSNKNLNLITCSGTWDASSRNYSERTVVFSKLVD